MNEREGVFSKDFQLRILKRAVVTVFIFGTFNAALQPPLTEYREHQAANSSVLNACKLNLHSEMNIVSKLKDPVCSG
jgi:hypothetical protein